MVFDIAGSLERIAAARNKADLSVALGMVTSALGFEWYALDILVTLDGANSTLVATNYPALWMRRYVEQRYTRDDIVVSHALGSVKPARWGGPGVLPNTTAKQRAILDEAAEAGLRSGAVIPVHGPGPAKSVLAVASRLCDQEFASLFALQEHRLQLIAAYAIECASNLGIGKLATSFALSPREVEILTRTALGDSANDIADLLSISQHTVVQHLENCRRKLDARNKTHAAAIAIAYGIVRL